MKNQYTNHRRGMLIAGAGVLVISFDALLIRLADSAPADVTFWRGTLIFLSLTAFLWITGRLEEWRAYWKYGWLALLITGLYSANTGLFVFAISHTSVANTVVILSSSCFFAALFSWLMLRETLALRTWVAILAALAGLWFIFATDLGSGGRLGDLFALATAASLGLSLTLMRRFARLPVIPVIALGSLGIALAALPFAQPLGLPFDRYPWLLIMGLAQMPAALVCLLVATRYLPAPEVSFFLLIETVLGPLWVWFVLGETVATRTFIGGGVILATIAAHAYWSLCDERAASLAP
ncbi:MAG TPA: DMT family transporter [Candidatus Competibacteraceae bacterium]|nr:DMT family transporter [Candidatus Competibacteraceae bacterium]